MAQRPRSAHMAFETLLITIAAASMWALPGSAGAQQTDCRILCDPAIHLQFGAVRTHVLASPRVRSLSTGAVTELGSRTLSIITTVMTVRTGIPRTSLLASVSWLPNAKRGDNPFTEYTASEVGESIRANAPIVTMGASVVALTASQLSNFASLAFNVADQFGAAARPEDESAYTHKLDLAAVATLMPFSELPAATYFHGVDLIGILDYVATGLPDKGDEVPLGERVFVDDANSTSLIVVLSFPVAPLS